MYPDLSTLPKGFTINMAHYVKRVKEIKDGFLINGGSWLRLYVDSTYSLGYVFGASLSKGVVNLSNYRGQVKFRLGDEDPTVLYESIENSFNIAPRFRNSGYELIVYSKPISRLISELGSGESRNLPSKYLVNNKLYLRGIKDSLEYFKGHLPDERDIINQRKFSPVLKDLHRLLTNIE